MIAIRLNDKKYQCPSSWKEVKTRQYVRILLEWDPDKDIADRDYFKLLCILTDAPFGSFNADIESQVSLISILGWVITEPFKFSEELPKVLHLGGKTIEIPRDPNDLSIGQNIHLRRDYLDKSKIIQESMSIATAIYLQPLIDGKLYDINRAKEIAKEIDEMPIDLIYPIGFFLLRRAQSFGALPEPILPRILNNLKKRLKNLWLNLQKSIGSEDTTIFH